MQPDYHVRQGSARKRHWGNCRDVFDVVNTRRSRNAISTTEFGTRRFREEEGLRSLN